MLLVLVLVDVLSSSDTDRFKVPTRISFDMPARFQDLVTVVVAVVVAVVVEVAVAVVVAVVVAVMVMLVRVVSVLEEVVRVKDDEVLLVRVAEDEVPGRALAAVPMCSVHAVSVQTGHWLFSC